MADAADGMMTQNDCGEIIDECDGNVDAVPTSEVRKAVKNIFFLFLWVDPDHKCVKVAIFAKPELPGILEMTRGQVNISCLHNQKNTLHDDWPFFKINSQSLYWGGCHRSCKKRFYTFKRPPPPPPPFSKLILVPKKFTDLGLYGWRSKISFAASAETLQMLPFMD